MPRENLTICMSRNYLHTHPHDAHQTSLGLQAYQSWLAEQGWCSEKAVRAKLKFETAAVTVAGYRAGDRDKLEYFLNVAAGIAATLEAGGEAAAAGGWKYDGAGSASDPNGSNEADGDVGGGDGRGGGAGYTPGEQRYTGEGDSKPTVMAGYGKASQEMTAEQQESVLLPVNYKKCGLYLQGLGGTVFVFLISPDRFSDQTFLTKLSEDVSSALAQLEHSLAQHDGTVSLESQNTVDEYNHLSFDDESFAISGWCNTNRSVGLHTHTYTYTHTHKHARTHTSRIC